MDQPGSEGTTFFKAGEVRRTKCSYHERQIRHRWWLSIASTRFAARCSHFAVAILILAAPILPGCVSARNIQEPISGAIEVTLPDSTRHVIKAAESAIADEGVGIELSDRKRGFVESEIIDIGAVRAMADRSSYHPAERSVRFRFWTRPTFGGTRLSAEVVYRFMGANGGRAMERMVPSDHAGREVLARMITRIEIRLREGRESRKQEAQKAPPPAS